MILPIYFNHLAQICTFIKFNLGVKHEGQMFSLTFLSWVLHFSFTRKRRRWRKRLKRLTPQLSTLSIEHLLQSFYAHNKIWYGLENFYERSCSSFAAAKLSLSLSLCVSLCVNVFFYHELHLLIKFLSFAGSWPSFCPCLCLCLWLCLSNVLVLIGNTLAEWLARLVAMEVHSSKLCSSTMN